jgi:hypothetical protein
MKTKSLSDSSKYVNKLFRFHNVPWEIDVDELKNTYNLSNETEHEELKGIVANVINCIFIDDCLEKLSLYRKYADEEMIEMMNDVLNQDF